MDGLKTQPQTELLAIKDINDLVELLGRLPGSIIYTTERARRMDGYDIGVTFIKYLLIQALKSARGRCRRGRHFLQGRKTSIKIVSGEIKSVLVSLVFQSKIDRDLEDA